MVYDLLSTFLFNSAEPHSSVGRVLDLRTGGCWFDPLLSQYSFLGLMIVIATGFIPLSPLSISYELFMWESSQRLGKNIVQSTGRTPGKYGLGERQESMNRCTGCCNITEIL